MNSSEFIWILIGTSFITYFIVSMVYKKLGIHNLKSALMVNNGLRLLNLKHILGIFLFGIVFYAILPEFRFLIQDVEIPKPFLLSLFLITLFLSAYISKVSVKNKLIKIENVSCYNISNAWVYFTLRFIFLLCYEYFFRGVLFFKFLEFNSLFFAILYSTLLYLLIHVFDSRKEIVGTIPFGIVLCIFAYFTNSIWYVFFIHLALSAVYEITIFYHLTLKNKLVS